VVAAIYLGLYGGYSNHSPVGFSMFSHSYPILAAELSSSRVQAAYIHIFAGEKL
jgi:hypothetical protein